MAAILLEVAGISSRVLFLNIVLRGDFSGLNDDQSVGINGVSRRLAKTPRTCRLSHAYLINNSKTKKQLFHVLCLYQKKNAELNYISYRRLCSGR